MAAAGDGGRHRAGTRGEGIVIGVVTSHDDLGRAEKLVEGLPRSLSEHVDRRTDWRERAARRFTQLAVSSNVRLLAGMIRANRPTRVMGRLSRSATAALGTGAYALSSSSIWTTAHASTWPRLVAVGA